MLLLILAAACADRPTPPPGDSSDPDAALSDGGTDGGTDGGETADTGGCEEGLDSDGDGFEDCDELACVSDPGDADEWCYACGWPHGDPGTLTSSGDDLGDTIKNIRLLDSCQEWVDLWDFAGQYWIVMITTGWCEPCYQEAKLMPAHQEDFRDESGLGQGFGYMIVLYQDAQLNGADDQDVAAFEAATGVGGQIPVLAEPSEGIIDDVPWEDVLPGKCALTPEMEILYCYSGEDDTQAFEAIRAHAGR